VRTAADEKNTHQLTGKRTRRQRRTRRLRLLLFVVA